MTQSEVSTRENEAVEVLVYSDDQSVRSQVIQALGRRVSKDLPEIHYTEAATWQGADLLVQEKKFNLLILDAETPKLGGIGFGKKVRDEYDPSMPYVVLIARPQDEWLARFSKPNGIVEFPIRPRELSEVVAKVLRDTL